MAGSRRGVGHECHAGCYRGREPVRIVSLIASMSGEPSMILKEKKRHRENVEQEGIA